MSCFNYFIKSKRRLIPAFFMQLQSNSIIKEYSDRIILDNINFTITDGQHIGLIGQNGSGKTTLLKILVDQEIPDKGQVIKIPKNISVGFIPQVTDFNDQLSVIDNLTNSLSLSESEIYQIYIALNDLQIGDIATKLFGQLSAGQKTKVYLARILIQQPDILLLDEPTNHLDIQSIQWLESYLQNYSGAFLVISHDRRFLDNITNTIFELNNGQIKTYGGNYSFYRYQKQIELDAQQRNFIAQEKKVARLQELIRVVKNKTQQREVNTSGADFKIRKQAAASASRAKSTEKMLAKELNESGIEKPQPIPELSVLFRPKQESSQIVVYLDNISVSFNHQNIIEKFSLVINHQDRLALIGPNGSGKSTLVKTILSQIKPNTGNIQIGNHVDIGYLPQEHHQINSSLTLLNYLIAQSKIDRTSAYRLAKRFLFTEDDLNTEVNKLSSGQKSKLSLAAIMASGANFIILDEPTNYLDIPSREALESALISYTGTLLVISHDRYFLDRISPSKIINLI